MRNAIQVANGPRHIMPVGFSHRHTHATMDVFIRHRFIVGTIGNTIALGECALIALRVLRKPRPLTSATNFTFAPPTELRCSTTSVTWLQ